MSVRLRFAVWAGLVTLLIVTLAALAWALMPMHWWFNGAANMARFLGVFVTVSLMLGAMAWLLHTTPPGALRLKPRVSFWLILLVAMGVRLAVVAGNTGPVLSDDIYRYVHDGRTLAAGEHPYAHAPAEVGTDLSINHPHLVTIYPPTAQSAFALLAMTGGGQRTFRLGFVLVDGLVIVLLMRMLHRQGRSLWWAALYAWHPLPITEFAGGGHLDVLGIALMLAALSGFRAQGSRIGAFSDHRSSIFDHRFLPPLLLALAAGVKPVVLPLALLMGWRGTLLAGSAFAAMLLPFALWEPGLERWIDTLRTFASTWAFNASVHPLLGPRWLGDALQVIVPLLLMLLLRRRPLAAAQAFLLASLLLSSTVHPWYLTWALATLPLVWNPVVWVWSTTIAFAHIGAIDRNHWAYPDWAYQVQYVPVYLALAVFLIDGLTRRGTRRIFSSG